MATSTFLLVASVLLVAFAGAQDVLDVEELHELIDQPSATFVMFYAPWCGHCKKLKPVWSELAQEHATSTEITIGMVDCTQTRDICVEEGIEGYPTLMFYEGNGVRGIRYTEGRSLQALNRYVAEMLRELRAGQMRYRHQAGGGAVHTQSTVLKLDDATFDDVADEFAFVKFYAPWCKHCKTLAPVWEDLSKVVLASGSDLVIAEVDCTAHVALCDRLSIPGYPHLALFADGQKIAVHQSERTIQSFLDFISIHADQLDADDDEPGKHAINDDQKEEEEEELDLAANVLVVTSKNFKRVKSAAELVLVNGCVDWSDHCVALAPEWIEVAEYAATIPNLKLAELDCSSHPALCQQLEVKGYPELILFVSGKPRKHYTGHRDAASIKHWLSQSVSL